ncbi:MAG: metalloendopeptidase [Gracilibacter sp. BRH_c7a]|nr:MAG: metalloendopeptidase [Gracilibacter sp. BRH_c7a]
MANHARVKIILITLLLVFAFVIPAAGDDLNDAIRHQQQLQNEQSRAQGQLKSLTSKADQMTKQIQQLTRQISAAEIDLEKKENAYEKAIQNVEIAEKEVKDKQAELDDRQETLRKRVRSIYEEGQMSYLEVLFQSTDISDFISRIEYLGCLVDNDQKILTDIRIQKDQLDKKKEQLIAKKEEAEQLKTQAIAAKNYLNNSKAQKEVALADNQKYQDELLVQIEKLEKDSKALEAKIRELQKNSNGVIGYVGVWPTPGYWYITSPYGYRTHPITRKYTLHSGVDIAAPNRAKIVSAGAGVVIYSGWYGAYGNAVIIDHGNGLSTLYGHMSSIAVPYGRALVAGQTIGYVGSTGWSTGPHLHFEVRKNGTPTSPMQYYN